METFFRLLLAALLLGPATGFSQQDYEREWSRFSVMVDSGRTKTALDIATDIYEKATKDGNVPHRIKARLKMAQHTLAIDPQAYPAELARLEQEVSKADFPYRSLGHFFLAKAYLDYHRQNRWRLEGLAMEATPGKEIAAWPAETVLDTSAAHMRLALKERKKLQQLPVSYLSVLLENDTNAGKHRHLRPTVYDFIAHGAIAHWEVIGQAEAGAATPPFKPEYFAPAKAFITIDFSGEPENSGTEILKTFKHLLEFHVADEDPSAFIHADLERLENARGQFPADTARQLYVTALEHLQSRYGNHKMMSEISFRLAQHYRQLGMQYHPYNHQENRWDIKKAVEICEAAIDAFPASIGAHNCRVLLKEIRQPAISVSSEYLNRPGHPILLMISHKNVRQVYYRVYKTDYLETLEERMEYGNKPFLPSGQPVQEGTWDNFEFNTGDFQAHRAEVLLKALSPGYYRVFVSNTPDFVDSLSVAAKNGFWVSQLTYLARAKADGTMEVRVYDGQSGHPVPKAITTAYKRKWLPKERRYELEKAGSKETDKTGLATFQTTDDQHWLFFHFQKGEDELWTNDLYAAPESRGRNEDKQTNLFTDRMIYRPGQTVYFKGVCYTSGSGGARLDVGRKTIVRFYDVNYQLIETKEFTANEFGSYAGSFTIPEGKLNGRMSIGDGYSQISFRVEEYKRPTFEVKVEQPKQSFRVGDDIEVTGKALAYSGMPVSGAKVQYRVVRRTYVPWFWRWQYSLPVFDETEVARGNTETDASGNFLVAFRAVPDPSLGQESQATFTYEVEAIVTDASAETQSGKVNVHAGYRSLRIDHGIPDMVNLDRNPSYKVVAENLAGKNVGTAVQYTVYRLLPPTKGPLLEKKWEAPDQFPIEAGQYRQLFPHLPRANEGDYRKWEKGDITVQGVVATSQDTMLSFSQMKNWPQGHYLIEFSANDQQGRTVKETHFFEAYDPSVSDIPTSVAFRAHVGKTTLEPGEEVNLLVGSAFEDALALVEIELDKQIIEQKWVKLDQQQRLLIFRVKEEWRGNAGVHVTMVHTGRVFEYNQLIEVPFTNKQLDLQLSVKRTDLLPGSQEKWTLTVKDHQQQPVLAEVMAGMYDASLDALVPPVDWKQDFMPSRRIQLNWINPEDHHLFDEGTFGISMRRGHYRHRTFDQLDPSLFVFGRYYAPPLIERDGMGSTVRTKNMAMKTFDMGEAVATGVEAAPAPADVPQESPAVAVQPRQNFNETAFFKPQLRTNGSGETVIEFTLPESLTRWRFRANALTKDLSTGYHWQLFEAKKDLMVLPNLPRFVRQGDTLFITARVSNLGEGSLSGNGNLKITDPISGKDLTNAWALSSNTSFQIDSGATATVSWKVRVPESAVAATITVTGSAGSFTDGEEHTLPVLPRAVPVTETMAITHYGTGTQQYLFKELQGKTVSPDDRLTLEYTSNPQWTVALALPYLMERQNESAEQVFSRFYANALASHIARSIPGLKETLKNWRETDSTAFSSNLQQNQDLKSVGLDETPWVREALREEDQRKQIAELFDKESIQQGLKEGLNTLRELQLPDGSWPWFPGMRSDRFVTQRIVAGIGHLKKLGAWEGDAETLQMVANAMQWMDMEARKDWQQLVEQKADMGTNLLSPVHVQWLYARSFFPEVEMDPEVAEAQKFYLAQAKKYWLKQSRYMQAMISLVLFRSNEPDVAKAVLLSLKENAMATKELGMWWNSKGGWRWHESSLLAQALAIEAFHEINGDEEAVAAMKLWLLRQKQARGWETTIATADACYAFLLTGDNELVKQTETEISVGNESVGQDSATGPIGYIRQSWKGGEIPANPAQVSVASNDGHVSWGGIYWQHFVAADEVPGSEKGALHIEKEVFVNRNGKLAPAPTAEIVPGDEIVVKFTLSTDRDMEYVHVKDLRAAALEPVSPISGYRWEGGLGYYRQVKDASMHFFFSFLPRGTHVLEYSLRVNQKGSFTNGHALIECLYAPEFAGHSSGGRVVVSGE